MRPLGQFPPWGGSVQTPPGYGFKPGHGPPPAGPSSPVPTNYAFWNFWNQKLAAWFYRDAIEVQNWSRSTSLGAASIVAQGFNAFSYDATRGLYFCGGQSTSSVNGLLYYSYDGWNWTAVSSGVLPTTTGMTDTANYYKQAVSDAGQYFTWRDSTIATIAAGHVYLNDNAGLAGWAASANQGTHTAFVMAAAWAQNDNRFIVMGVKSAVNCAFAVDVTADGWVDLVLPGAALEVPAFVACSPGDRVVATQTKLWRTATVASAFAAVRVPWQSPPVARTLLNLIWLPESFVFLAVTAQAIYASPNGVRWDQVVTGFEGLGTFSGPANGLGDAVLVAFRRTNPDGQASDLFLTGRNALRSWSAYQAPQALASGAQPILDIKRGGGRLVSINTNSPTAVRYSLGIK